jgi:hypothetical protein
VIGEVEAWVVTCNTSLVDVLNFYGAAPRAASRIG